MYENLLKEYLEINGNFTFSRSGGPGGQNVNKVNTKVTIHLPLRDLVFMNNNEIDRIRESLSNKLNSKDELVLSCEEERSQSKNRSKLIYKTVIVIEKALVVKKHRKSTKPTKASMKRRIEAKKRLSLKKECRRIKDFY